MSNSTQPKYENLRKFLQKIGIPKNEIPSRTKAEEILEQAKRDKGDLEKALQNIPNIPEDNKILENYLQRIYQTYGQDVILGMLIQYNTTKSYETPDSLHELLNAAQNYINAEQKRAGSAALRRPFVSSRDL